MKLNDRQKDKNPHDDNIHEGGSDHFVAEEQWRPGKVGCHLDGEEKGS